jgi:hypothetical protein
VPLRVAYVRSSEARRTASELIARHGIDLLHADRERVAPIYAGIDVAKVLDATDSISMYLQGVIRHGPPSQRVLAALELPKMRRYERSMGEGYQSCLVTTDIDAQTANPLAILRTATAHAHAVLADFEVPPVPRDRFAEDAFPGDVYDLVPATWVDIHPSLQDPGVTWGAAKAYLHKARRRDEGQL